jgi:DNA-binding transcriptional MerR regulator|tara:strand:+ start:94135 stop:94530 length:396 start_codon:yes stop_codon:yes gene_type:complete
MGKSASAFRTISEVSDEVGVPQHVLRFWETKFKEVSPLKRGGGRRYYRPEDVDLIRAVNRLLYSHGYTIKGVQKLLREQGVKAVTSGETAAPPPVATPHSEGGPGMDAAFLRDLRSIRDRLSGALQSAQIS